MSPPSESEFVSILRRPDGLFAYVVDRRDDFSIPAPQPADAEIDLGAADPYVERLLPLRNLPLPKRSPLHSVLESWKILGHVGQLDGTLLFHLVNVLIHSLPDETGGKGPRPLAFEPEAPVFRPTAANPRAYRGTKDRPPKFKKPRPLDLRPHLASARDINELISRLAPFATDAARLLKKADTLTSDLPPLLDRDGRVRDVYVSCLHEGSRETLVSLPPLFRRGFVFWRRGEPWQHIRRVLALYQALDLEKRPPLRRSFERLMTLAPFQETMKWGELIAETPRERQVALTELLVEGGIRSVDCPEDFPEILHAANDLLPTAHYRHGMHALLSSLKKGGDPRYLLSGFELAQSFNPRVAFETVGTAARAPVPTIRRLVDHARDKQLAMTLWDACGKLEEFDRILESIPWLELPAVPAKDLLYLLANSMYDTHLEPGLQKAKWSVLRKAAPGLFERVRSVSERYQGKAIRHLKQIAWFWDTPEALAWALKEVLKFLPRICRPPFLEKGCDERLFAVLTNLQTSDWERISKAPDDVLRALENSCRRDNDAILVASGARFLALEMSESAADAILQEPAAVLKSAERLGGLGRSLRHDAMNQWKAHPLMQEGFTELPTEKLIALLLRHLPPEVSAGVPRKLKDHFAGGLRLSPEQLDRGRKAVLDALPGIRWRLLGHLCLERLSRPLRPSGGSSKIVHAVRFYGHIDENRRALRRFLRAHFDGDADYLRRHPRNQDWLRRQQRLNRNVWLEGMEKKATLRDGSRVRLHIELDPLEALRLGTYVGSCTGLGGSFAYSAAAVVLDLNKHVVYARSDQGAVLGRQLIAVSEEEELVVFAVYPRGVAPEMKRLFREYDLELAKKLSLNIYVPGDKSTTSGRVALLLSKDWWDDCAWDLAEEEEASQDPVP